MENQKKLIKNILSTTIKIKEEHPELTKYLDEMPFHGESVDFEDVSSKDLIEYQNTLNDLLKSYTKAH